MWICDLQKAIENLAVLYAGRSCCVSRIAGNVITMTNFKRYLFDGNGNLTELPEIED